MIKSFVSIIVNQLEFLSCTKSCSCEYKNDFKNEIDVKKLSEKSNDNSLMIQRVVEIIHIANVNKKQQIKNKRTSSTKKATSEHDEAENSDFSPDSRNTGERHSIKNKKLDSKARNENMIKASKKFLKSNAF